MNNNIFAISRVGQLRNIQGYIEQYNAKNNILIIMDTINKDDVALIDNINKNIDHKKFKEVIYFEIPERPLSVTKKKCKEIYENLTTLLYSLYKKYHYQNIILCNTDNYYKYFEVITKDKNLNLILLEEGLTTYRMFAKNIEKNFNFRDIKSAVRRVFTNLKQLIIDLGVLTLKFLSWVLQINIFEFVKHHRVPKKYRYGNIDYFKEAYVCFPEKMKTLTTREEIGEVKKLNFFINRNIDRTITDRLEDNMILFVNQRYIPYEKHFNIIFEILERNRITKFFIKFHPKESKNKYSRYLKDAMQKFPNLEVKILKGMDHIPAEDLMVTGKIKRIIGITTSTLIYSELINPNIEVLSIADSYKKLCLSKKYNVDAKRMDLFLRDYKAFKEVFDIKQV